ncbi:MAG: hypothetical protein ACI4V1_04890 [Eubacteriales bacterium]
MRDLPKIHKIRLAEGERPAEKSPDEGEKRKKERLCGRNQYLNSEKI